MADENRPPLFQSPDQVQQLQDRGLLDQNVAQQALQTIPQAPEMLARPEPEPSQIDELVQQVSDVGNIEQQASDEEVESISLKLENETPQDAFNRKKNEIAAAQTTNFGARIPTDAEVLDALEREQIDLQESDAKGNEDLKRRLTERKQLLDRAASVGIKLDRNDELDSILDEGGEFGAAMLDSENQKLADEQDTQTALHPTKAQVEEDSRALREAASKQEAEQKNAFAQEERQRQKSIDIQEQMVQEDQDIENEAQESGLFANKTTGQKIAAAIAIMLGAVSQGLTGAKNNPALQVMQKAMEDDFKKQKMAKDERLAKMQMGFKLERLKLEQFEAKSKNKLRQAQIGEIKQALLDKEEDLQKQRELGKKVGSTEGFTRAELEALDKDSRDRAVAVGKDKNKFLLAVSKTDADKLKAPDGPVRSGESAVDGLSRLLEISDEVSLGKPVEFLKNSVEAVSLQQQLVGLTRLQLFGPGVLQKFEQDLARKLIADPTKILSITALQRIRLKTLRDMTIKQARNQMRSSGLPLTDNANERNAAKINKIKARFKDRKITDSQASDALRKSGQWEEVDGLF